MALTKDQPGVACKLLKPLGSSSGTTKRIRMNTLSIMHSKKLENNDDIVGTKQQQLVGLYNSVACINTYQYSALGHSC